MTKDVPPSDEPLVEETEPRVLDQSQVRFRTLRGDSLRECGQEEGEANASISSSEKAGGVHEVEDSKLSLLVTTSAERISSDTAQEVVQEEATRKVGNRGLKCPSSNRKGPRTCSCDSLCELGQETGRTIQRVNANDARGSSSVEEDGSSREEDDSTPALVTSSSAAQIRIDTVQEVVDHEEASPDACLPPGWTLMKVEPDW
jgi:hypothetical protein